jgi:hypothetical protein
MSPLARLVVPCLLGLAAWTLIAVTAVRWL